MHCTRDKSSRQWFRSTVGSPQEPPLLGTSDSQSITLACSCHSIVITTVLHVHVCVTK